MQRRFILLYFYSRRNDSPSQTVDSVEVNENAQDEIMDDDSDEKDEENFNVDLVLSGNSSDRCHSAGYMYVKETNFENLRRGSNGYHSKQTKMKLITPNSLGEAITSVIQGLEENIRTMKMNHDITVKQLRIEQEQRFTDFSRDQEETLLKISKNISDTEEETRRIKEEAVENVKSLKATITEVSHDSFIASSSSGELQERQKELQAVTDKHDSYIKDLTANISKISAENRDAVTFLLENLEKAKKVNDDILDKHSQAIDQLRETHETAFKQLKEELEKVKDLNEIIQSDSKDREEARLENSIKITSKIDCQEKAIKDLEDRLSKMSSQTFEMHNELRNTHSQSMSDLRDEFFSQIIVNKELSNTLQDEFNEKLETMNRILNNEKTSNQSKIEEMKEALHDIGAEMQAKLGTILFKFCFYLSIKASHLKH